MFRAKLTNLGIKSLIWLAVPSFLILASTTVLTAATLKSLDCSVMTLVGGSLAVCFFVGLPLALYLALRPRYLTFDGTTITGSRPFFTVRKQVEPTGHALGNWKYSTTNLDDSNVIQGFIGGPIIKIACQSGTLSIGCLDPSSSWLGKVPIDSQPMSPDFTIGAKDFSPLLEALRFTIAPSAT